jgi:hypothetical protein
VSCLICCGVVVRRDRRLHRGFDIAEYHSELQDAQGSRDGAVERQTFPSKTRCFVAVVSIKLYVSGSHFVHHVVQRSGFE